MDLLDLLILALRIVLVALLYLFLASVMRMAASGLRPRRTRGVEPVPVPVPVLRLVVLESGSSDLVPGQAVELKDAAILGRAERAEVGSALAARGGRRRVAAPARVARGASGMGHASELMGLGVRLMQNPIVRGFVLAAVQKQIRQRMRL